MKIDAETLTNLTELAFYHAGMTKYYYILGNFEKAKKSGLFLFINAEHAIGVLINLEGQFYYALTIFNNIVDIKQLPADERKKIKIIYTRLKMWAKWNPDSFHHYLLLFEAEYARIKQLKLNAIPLYQQVIEIAHDKNILHFIGIANECASRFYLDLKLIDTAKLHYLNAHYAFKTWGAIMKCHQMEKAKTQWFQETSAITTPVGEYPNIPKNINTSIEVLSILKTAQAISEELDMDKLLQKLIYIILQNAGAQRGLFIVKEDTGWYVEAEGTIAEQHISLTKTEPDRTANGFTLIAY